jgi:hypothetical protein
MDGNPTKATCVQIAWLALPTCGAHRLILLAAQSRVHYIFSVGMRRNTDWSSCLRRRKSPTAISPAKAEPAALHKICNIASARPPSNMSLSLATKSHDTSSEGDTGRMQGTEGLGQLSHVLEPVLPIFGCDRVWLAYPCDTESRTWRMVAHIPVSDIWL